MASNLRNLGFIVVIIKNTKSATLKEILSCIISKIYEESYCKLFCKIYNSLKVFKSIYYFYILYLYNIHIKLCIYFFTGLVFYAGHGCELLNTKCILGTDCPVENIDFSHCVTENWILREIAKCKPELCLFIMDMCRINLDR